MPGFSPTPEAIAVLTTKYWGAGGVRLTVGFLDDPPADLRARIIVHMNAWNKSSNIQFVESRTNPKVRVARKQGDGYWSYLGTDILSIPPGEPTMNLNSFSMSTPDSEFHRVIRHEAGHTLGFPHEHMRRELVNMIDREKAIEFFMRTQGWTREEVIHQVLTPIEEATILGTAHADPDSIMCYQIPGSITVNGEPIAGGLDIDTSDFEFVGSIYPKTLQGEVHAVSAGAPVSQAPAMGYVAESAMLEVQGRAAGRVSHAPDFAALAGITGHASVHERVSEAPRL